MAEDKKLIANANSKGLILNYYGSNSKYLGRKADFNLNTAIKIIKNDPVVKGALISLCDKVMGTPYQVIAKDKRSKKTKLEMALRELRFSKVLRKIIFNMLLYGNCFVEIVKKGGKTTDINVLETTRMEILAENNGDVTGYQQIMGNDNQPIKWDKEKIVHFKLTDITTNTWGEVDIESIYETVLIKDHVRTWINWFFATNQARGFYNIESAGEQKVKDFLSNLKANERDLGKPVIAQGKITYQVLRTFAEEGKSLNEVLLWCNTELLALLQVPPIVMGFPDMSGRANSSEQQSSLNVRVNSIQQILEDYVTYELFPKMSYDKVMLEFGALDEKAMKQTMETLVMMKNAGFSNEAMTEWLREQDMFFETKKVFNEPEDMMMGMKEGGNDKNATGQSEGAPSRARKGEGEANKQKDQISTRADQLVANSEEVILDQYAEVFKK
jgi:hypothetical protein